MINSNLSHILHRLRDTATS